MTSPDFSSMFSFDRESVDGSVEFAVVPSHGGGWAAVSAALTALLLRASARGLWWATLDLGDDERVACAHLGPNDANTLWTEVSSDWYLPKDQHLTPAQIEALGALGWTSPLDEDGMRNFHCVWPAEELRDACDHVLHTLAEVYGFADSDEVRVSVDPFE